MPANTAPIYTLTPDVANNGTTGMNAAITAAAADYNGAGAANVLVHTAGSNGSYVRRLRFKSVGTNVATVARIHLNNGSANTSAANNSFFGELGLPATAASASSPTVDIDYSLEFALPAGFRIYVGLGTAVAAGWVVTCLAGKY